MHHRGAGLAVYTGCTAVQGSPNHQNSIVKNSEFHFRYSVITFAIWQNQRVPFSTSMRGLMPLSNAVILNVAAKQHC